MLVLFDNGTPRGIARFLQGHTVIETREQGWDTLRNGELLTAAEAPYRPQNCHCGTWERQMEAHQAISGTHCRRSKRRDTRKLYGSKHSR
jgi:hypothetical protein